MMKTVWRSGKDIFTSLRWLGPRLNAEVDMSVAGTLNVGQAYGTGEQATRQLRQDIQYLSNALVLTDPASTAGHQHQ